VLRAAPPSALLLAERAAHAHLRGGRANVGVGV